MTSTHRPRRPGSRLVAAVVTLALLPSASRAQARGAAPAVHVIDSIAAASLSDGRAAGMALVVMRGADTVVARAYGVANVASGEALRIDHVFQIASITKQFTAAAILRLVAAGRVALDDPVARHLPAAPVQPGVTVRQLLTHSAGIPDYAESEALRKAAPARITPDSILAFVRDVPPYFQPGEQMRYSNSGYVVLGQLIERVTGLPYARFVVDSVLRPAGLRHIWFCDDARATPRATGHSLTPTGLAAAKVVDPSIPWAAGGFCSTATDLASWNVALHGGRLLDRARLAEMTRPATLRSGRRTRYGLGTMVGDIAGRLAIHHGGDIDGFTSHAAWFPEDSLTVVVLVNTQGPVRPLPVIESVVTALLGAARPRALTPPANLQVFAGRYAGGVEISVADGSLRLARPPLPTAVLRYAGDRRFTDGRSWYEFEIDERSGVATQLWADLGVAYVRWPRRPAPSL